MRFTTEESLYVLGCISESQMEVDHDKLLKDQNMLIYFEDVCDEWKGFKVNLDNFFMDENKLRSHKISLEKFINDIIEINENGLS